MKLDKKTVLIVGMIVVVFGVFLSSFNSKVTDAQSPTNFLPRLDCKEFSRTESSNLKTVSVSAFCPTSERYTLTGGDCNFRTTNAFSDVVALDQDPKIDAANNTAFMSCTLTRLTSSGSATVTAQAICCRLN